MAHFKCSECDFEGHFVEFLTGSLSENDDELDDEIDEDELTCPSCGSTCCYEL